MTKIILDWQTFQTGFMTDRNIYVKETETSWIMYTYDGPFKIICEKIKSSDDEKNMMFIEKYFTDRKNIIKIISYENEIIYSVNMTMNKELEEPKEPEEDFVEKVEYKNG